MTLTLDMLRNLTEHQLARELEWAFEQYKIGPTLVRRQMAMDYHQLICQALDTKYPTFRNRYPGERLPLGPYGFGDPED